MLLDALTPVAKPNPERAEEILEAKSSAAQLIRKNPPQVDYLSVLCDVSDRHAP